MEISSREIDAKGIKFFLEKDGKEAARAYLYFLKNDLHDQPFGFMEDVYVDESLRGQGVGTKLVNMVIEAAEHAGCYKLVATSRLERDKVHALYEKLGFQNYGREFRINFS